MKPFLLFVSILLISGCYKSKDADLPVSGDIVSIDIKLNEIPIGKYWDYEGTVNSSVWEDVRPLLSVKPYTNDVAAWQSLSVINLTLKSGRVVFLQVYQTGESMGCYELSNQKGYYIIPDEKSFFVHMKQLLTEKVNVKRVNEK
jgi:hypothetical protein